MNKTERNLEKLRKIVVKKALEGEKIKEIAHKYMVSRKFVYKWLKRFRENPEGEWWKDRSSRPKTIHRKVDEELKERIRELRIKQGMNVEKIAYLLKREGKALSQTTVTKVIKELGLPLWVNRKKRKRPRYKSFERQKPNELWQIDVKGPFWVEEQGQHLHLITLIDDHSRFCLGAKFHPFAPKKEQIINLLEEAIKEYGYPESILTDNGALFSSVRGGTSTFSRWCQTEGIKHIRARVFHPETCGKVERLHGTQQSSVRWKD
ncbi:MAG: DDE-type integrase/transposase/recombinase [Candidatus Heimdallarchaeum endolithica]|uniref:DDE-type integrase/transposase/recombinase n=1 Tax=Candidatus Heimdallarchaeum endolithica TaxID=2876572 RepID=A0A9Y1FPE8_9ARCH|nr:MAG: DDE-type integrase/transposase/recombinase [Candidatus Heimdallarchaeum endolithica]